MNKIKFLLCISAVFLAGCGSSDKKEAPISQTNQAPSISSTAITVATEDLEYSYQVVATDDNNTELVYSINNAPNLMQISAAGLVTWTPTENELTSGEITLIVAESSADNALSTQQVFTVDVTPVNDSPTLTSMTASQTVDNGSDFSYQIPVVDVDDSNNGSDINFEVASAPAGLAVSNVGLISWTPTVQTSSDYTVEFKVSDGGEDGATYTTFTLDLSVLNYQQINGRVVNYFTGTGVTETTVTISDGETTLVETTADANGDFNLSVVDTQLTENNVISTFNAGFAEQARTINLNELALNQSISILPSNISSSFDSTLENSVSVDGNIIVSFAANSLVREDGQPINGMVNAEVTIIDPTIDINIMPGEMITMVDGEVALIESFGAVNVVLNDESGAAVNVAESFESEIRIPVGGSSFNAPDTIPLYYYNTVTGLWIEEGQADKTLIDGNFYYVGNVSHFTTWNADRVFETVFIEGCIVNADDIVKSNIRVRAAGSDYNGSSTAFTDSEGKFRIPVKQNSRVFLTGAQGSQSRTLTINTTTENKVLTDCIQLSEATSTMKLSWGKNPRDLDTHFYGTPTNSNDEFHVYFGNKSQVFDTQEIYLDVDDINSYGPEILTISDFPYAGRYQYIVNEFSGNSNIQDSPTRVELNLGSEISIFAPPSGTPTEFWHVFDFVVDESGTVVLEPINEWINDFDERKDGEVELGESMSLLRKGIVQKVVESKYYAK